MKYTLDEIRDKTAPIAKEYEIDEIYIFGSYAKGNANDDSDIDFFISQGGVSSLIQYFSFVYDLEKTFDCHVDVVTDGIEDVDFLESVMNDRVQIYGK